VVQRSGHPSDRNLYGAGADLVARLVIAIPSRAASGVRFTDVERSTRGGATRLSRADAGTDKDR